MSRDTADVDPVPDPVLDNSRSVNLENPEYAEDRLVRPADGRRTA
jgi:hypothetical protein